MSDAENSPATGPAREIYKVILIEHLESLPEEGRIGFRSFSPAELADEIRQDTDAGVEYLDMFVEGLREDHRESCLVYLEQLDEVVHFGGVALPASELAGHVRDLTEFGDVYLADFAHNTIKDRVSYKEACIRRLESMPEQDEKFWFVGRGDFSPAELVEEVQKETEVGLQFLDGFIVDVKDVMSRLEADGPQAPEPS